jgi:hypothetical protein
MWSCALIDGKAARACNQSASAPVEAESPATAAPNIPPPAPPAGSAAPPSIAESDPIAVGTPAQPVAGAPAAGSPTLAPTAGQAGAAGMAVAMRPVAAGSEAAAGTGGAAGASTAADGGMPALEPGALQCPNEVCAALPPLPAQAASSGFKIENCCAEGGDCGTALNDGACTRTADSVPDCPPLAAMGFTVPSCCTAMGQCGVDGTAFMRGCMSLEELTSLAGAFIEIPAPKGCTPAGM